MIFLKHIHSLSDFLRNAKSHISRLKKTGEPAILTVNGVAEAVVLSAEMYQKMLEEIDLGKTYQAIDRGLLESLRTGELSAEELIKVLRPNPQAAGIPAGQAFAELERRFDLRRKKKAS
jgi:PHD/YefM family antitoxin component YafN of YafNO toxin-antitoxin module